MGYILQNTRLGFCWWDLLALALLVGVVAFFIVKTRKAKKEKKELEDELTALGAGTVVPGEASEKV